MAVASPEGTSPQVPVNGATTAEEYGMPAVPIRRLCMCRGNCTGRIRHAAGECGKRSVSDRPLCSSCKAHKGSSLDKTRAPDEYAYYNEGVGTSGEGAEGADGQQGGEGGGAEGVAMEGIVPGQGECWNRFQMNSDGSLIARTPPTPRVSYCILSQRVVA